MQSLLQAVGIPITSDERRHFLIANLAKDRHSSLQKALLKHAEMKQAKRVTLIRSSLNPLWTKFFFS